MIISSSSSYEELRERMSLMLAILMVLVYHFQLGAYRKPFDEFLCFLARWKGEELSFTLEPKF